MNFAQAGQVLSGESIVVLYQIDLTAVGDPTVVYFTKEVQDPVRSASLGIPSRVSFLGQEYTPIQIADSGFEWTGVGPIPQPRIQVSNVQKLLAGLLIQYGNLVGAKVVRIQTYGRFLDGHVDAATASTSYIFDVYVVSQKTHHDKIFIEFALSSAMDQKGRVIPKRIALRDHCGWTYRTWNPVSATFDYSRATCPYTGSVYVDKLGNNTIDPARDQCSFHVATGCKPRFGTTAVLPFGGFPGMARIRS